VTEKESKEEKEEKKKVKCEFPVQWMIPAID
jgi:hypothetical protein